MASLSYNLSPTLKDLLLKAEGLSKQIRLLTISPATIYQIRWETAVSRIHSALLLLGIDKREEEIGHILGTYMGIKRIPPAPRQIVNYKKTLDHIWQTWIGNPKAITIKDLDELAKIMDIKLENKAETEQAFAYIQTENVNPIIQAAIAHLPQSNTPLAYLTPLLFLTKGGYHLKGLYCLERQWVKRLSEYRELVRSTTYSPNLTLWLEFFAQSLVYELEEVKQELSRTGKSKQANTKLLSLSDRQKAILALFDQPNVAITNTRVQTVFNVSQITASRDLSRLALLGLIFSRGGGRSVYYTKI